MQFETVQKQLPQKKLFLLRQSFEQIPSFLCIMHQLMTQMNANEITSSVSDLIKLCYDVWNEQFWDGWLLCALQSLSVNIGLNLLPILLDAMVELRLVPSNM